jgi:hypothetical protein
MIMREGGENAREASPDVLEHSTATHCSLRRHPFLVLQCGVFTLEETHLT